MPLTLAKIEPSIRVDTGCSFSWERYRNNNISDWCEKASGTDEDAFVIFCKSSRQELHKTTGELIHPTVQEGAEMHVDVKKKRKRTLRNDVI